MSDYVKNTDYAPVDKTGVIKARNFFRVSTTGDTYVESIGKEMYKSAGDTSFISKGTLESIKNDYVGSSTPVQDLTSTVTNIQEEQDENKPKNTASGEIVSVDDAIAYKTFNVTVDGASEQETTQGYNLCNGVNQSYYINTNTNLCGLSPENTGLSIETNGIQNFTISTNYQQARYRVACANALPSGAGSLEVTVYNGVNKDGTSDNITINTNGYSYLIINATDLSNIQIVEGTEAKPYEPYTGGQPSPNPDYPQEITTLTFDKITRCGKNLIPYPYTNTSKVYNGITFTDNGDGSITANGTATGDAYFDVMGNENNRYKIIGNYITGGNKDVVIYVTTKTEEGNYIGLGISRDDSNSIAIDTSIYDIGYIGLRIASGTTVNNVTVRPMMTMEPDTDYEPYQGQTYDIDLQGNEMVEIPNGVKDELVIDKYGNVSLIKNVGKIVLNGSESWKDNWQNSNFPDYIYFYLSADFLDNNYEPYHNWGNLISNNFQCSGSVWIADRELLALNPDMTKTLQISMLKSRVSDLTSFKQWLQLHNTIAYYELAEPQTIPLGTLSELITTLNGTNNISINGNIPTTISTIYALDIKKYIDNKLAEIASAMIEEG